MSTTNRSPFSRLFISRRRNTPRRPFEAFKTMATVVTLTILIWVYAENAQRRSEDVRIHPLFITSNAGLAATVSGPDESPEVQINLEGPRGQIDRFKRIIEENTVDGRLKLALPGNTDPGTKNIGLADAFKADLAYYGINVSVKANPAELPVLVEPNVTRDVGVQQPQGLSVTLQNVSFVPPRVSVTGPQSLFNREFGGDNPQVAIDTTGVNFSATTTPRTASVSIIPPPSKRLKLSQSQVNMTYEVGATIREGEIRAVFVDVRRPVADDGRSRVIIKGGPVIPNVRIIGPSNIVSQLIGNSPERRAKAVLTVTKDDVDKGELGRRVDIDFGSTDLGITPVGGPYEVTFEVRSVTPADTDR